MDFFSLRRRLRLPTGLPCGCSRKKLKVRELRKGRSLKVTSSSTTPTSERWLAYLRARKLGDVVMRFGGRSLEEDEGKFDGFHQAIANLQRFYGLEPTGDLDAKTSVLLDAAWCSHMIFGKVYGKMRQDVEKLCQWPGSRIYYGFGRSHPYFDSDEAAFCGVRKAIEAWNGLGKVEFVQEDGKHPADIVIEWASQGNHKDGFSFSDSGIAHADFPECCGWLNGVKYVHFNGAERWGDTTDYIVEAVAMHELGHILGFDDLQESKSVMYPSFNPGDRREITDNDKEDYKKFYK